MSTTIGTSDRPASTTAGWRLAAAVPLVHSSAAGTPSSPRPSATKAATRSSWTMCSDELGPRRQRQRHRRAPRAGCDDGVTNPAPHPFVDDRGAGGGVGSLRRPRSWSPTIGRVSSTAWQPSRRRSTSTSGATSSAPGATSASAGSSAPSPSSAARSTSKSGIHAFQLDPTASPGSSAAGGRGLRQEVRWARAARPGDHRAGDRRRRRGGARVPHGPRIARQHVARPSTDLVGRAARTHPCRRRR